MVLEYKNRIHANFHQQFENVIPILDETKEGSHLMKNLTSEDILKSYLLFVGSERIYNSKFITPPIREMDSTKKDMPDF